MKFEFVEFYPSAEMPNNKSKALGTVHIYAIDCKLDIRGILVFKQGKGIFFCAPHFRGIDTETGKIVKYPLIRWTNQETQQEMIDFLHKEAKPVILKSLKESKKCLTV